MSYTKQVWNTGEKITDDKLNHMEDGIESANSGGSTLIVRIDEEGAGDKTWQEVHDALANGIPTYVAYSYIDNPSASEEAHITGLFSILSAEQVIDTKTGTSTFEARLATNDLALIAQTADSHLSID